jgi:hypothetical protein
VNVTHAIAINISKLIIPAIGVKKYPAPNKKHWPSKKNK